MLNVKLLGTLGGQSNVRGLGQTYSKPMTLQKAVTSILTATAGVEAFPGRVVVIDAIKFDLIAQQATDRANEINWKIPFALSEAQQALQYRGYRRDVAIVALVAPVVPATPPTSQVVVGEQNRPIQYDPQPLLDAGANVTFTPRQNGPAPWLLVPQVPISPILPFPVDPLPIQREKNNTFLWIAGILTLYFLTSAGKNPHRSARRKRKGSVSGDLSGLDGLTANCVIWQEVEGKKGGLIWRCLGYGATCKGKSCQKPAFKFQTRTCVKNKKVTTKSPRFKLKTVDRCAKYERVCADGSCVSESLPKPEPSPAHGVNINRMVQDMARQMADDRNADEQTVGKEFGREIMDRGGIRAYRGRSRSGKRVYGGEEFAAVPIFMRRKDGLPLDEMASEMGFDDDTALLEAIKTEYPKGKGTKKRSWTAADFVADAESQVWSAFDADMMGGLGQDLFPGLKRELVLITDDTGTSDDPLEIFLQRKGWEISRVRELQDSIAEKAVPDMFTNKMAPLTAGEVELQRDIDEFLKEAIPVSTQYAKEFRAKAKKASKAKKDPFWIVDPVQQSLFGLGAPRAGRKKRVKYFKGSVNSAIDAALKTVGDQSLYVFATYYGYEIETEVPPWLDHIAIHPDGTVESHTRELRTGKWTVDILTKSVPTPTGVPTPTKKTVKEPEQMMLLGSH